MQQTYQDDKKTAVIKTLAIIGFVVGLVLAVWLAVQAVRLLPAAFGTLASIAESIRGEETDFTIASEKSISNSGDAFTISWTMLRTEGDYTFSYECADGVSAELRNARGDLVSVACDTEVSLPFNENSTEVIFESEAQRFTDVQYTIAYESDDGDVAFSRDGFVTVVNPDISANGTAQGNESPSEPEENEPSTPGTSTGGTGGSNNEVIGYITVPTVVTEYPVSNPNGDVDLHVSFIGVGTYSGSRFTKRSYLEEGERGALQFAVRNVGTKSSGTWYFNAELPTDPSFTYSSGSQSGLLPNEQQIITIQFDNVSDSRSERIDVRVSGGNDSRLGNNSFSERVDIR